jgi:excisionase family DNA binding protein
MLTTSEAAKILGVSTASIRVWLNEEGHPRFPNAQKFGRDWQIPESDLEGLPKGRKPGRPPKVANADGEVQASAENVGDQEPVKPKHRASKRSPVKKANVTKSAKKKGARAK